MVRIRNHNHYCGGVTKSVIVTQTETAVQDIPETVHSQANYRNAVTTSQQTTALSDLAAETCQRDICRGMKTFLKKKKKKMSLTVKVLWMSLCHSAGYLEEDTWICHRTQLVHCLTLQHAAIVNQSKEIIFAPTAVTGTEVY